MSNFGIADSDRFDGAFDVKPNAGYSPTPQEKLYVGDPTAPDPGSPEARGALGRVIDALADDEQKDSRETDAASVSLAQERRKLRKETASQLRVEAEEFVKG